MGLESEMQLIMSGFLNITQLVGVISSLWTMDRLGRRMLLLWGSAFMAMSHLLISVLVGRFSHDWPSFRKEGWIAAGSLLFYMLRYSWPLVNIFSDIANVKNSFGASWGPV